MRINTLLACLALAVVADASASDKHRDGDKHHSKYGGVVVEAKEIQYELVAKPESIAIFVEDHGKKVSTQGASAKVTLLTGKDKAEVTLAPAGENKLEAKGTFAVAKGTRAVAQVTLPGKGSTSVRFVVP